MRKQFSTKPETKLAKFHELNDEELRETEGGGWFKDAVYAVQDWFGFVGSDDDRVAAGTRA